MIYRLFSRNILSDSKLQKGLFAGLSMVMALILAPPILVLINGDWVSLSYIPFHQLCHQITERSFSVNGIPLAVCARCLGIFAGLWGTLAILTVGLPVKKLHSTRAAISSLMVVLSLNFIQFFIELFTGAASGNFLRFILGLGLGIHLILVIYSHRATLTNLYTNHGTASKTDIL